MKKKITISIVILTSIFIIIFLFQKFNIREEKVNSGQIDLNNNIHLSWSIKEFDKKFHKIEYCESIDAKYICKIDDKDWYGSDFKMDLPKNELESLTINIDKCSINLNVSEMFNPNYNGELNKNQFKLEKQKRIYILYGFFSDGSGTYTTKWIIKDCKSERSKLSNDEKDFEWQNSN
jgi:hypothetical protein